jgi:RNA polymerase sigma-70 factor (ECF subfamily)
MDKHLEIFRRIVNNDVQAYEILFKDYYRFLCSYAFGLTKERQAAEEIVEDFFVDLWNNREKINIATSVRSYFIGSIHNRCINYLQREKPKLITSHEISKLIDQEGTVGDRLITIDSPSILINELEDTLARAIDNLPMGCKEIFLLSRNENLSYKEISEKLQISINTVKTQIKVALHKLRDDLKDYLIVLLLIFLK